MGNFVMINGRKILFNAENGQMQMYVGGLRVGRLSLIIYHHGQGSYVTS